METTALTGVLAISPLQSDAWAAWNASYSAPVRDAYRSVGQALYRQGVSERIARLFAPSDEQNRYLDLMLNAKEKKRP